MVKRNWVLAVVAAVLAGVIVGILWPQDNSAPHSPQTRFDDGAGGVVFSAILRPRPAREAPLNFTVQLDTHEGDLRDYDVFRHVVLETSSGDQALPLQGSEVVRNESHHIRAQFYFPAARDDRITLLALDLRGVPERRLVFDL